ncbi:ParB/RepB/Spo0J family partition protein [Parashewanella spongiae]|uniref:Probable chromosome-partitioning protein ParB n=1 Tax=Parashewanella spongiae TaxID=342950 RepID=A0A3A6U065_9GAMM|nr:ParB/RepB/Spo0J family partition protein [Parashewanella spongiae]MCL1078038.1 ParB/RepB/Spo0J family partition protein [Parashewanella spongiae]RJY17443.1 ParB/RepB/Spo0J family partition protein [Parashewanella spongiae]
MTLRKRGLGKGLDALLSTSHAATQKRQQADKQVSEPIEVAADSDLLQLDIDKLVPGKYQPRKDMSADALDELAESIRVQGIIQPIVVRKLDASTNYEIIAGERRWRASMLAGIEKVPCIVKQVADDSAVAIALIENIQREDLNAMEEAVALNRLIEEFDLTHQQTADAVGKSRATISNLLRLNLLNDPVKRLLEHGDLDMGHARALLAIEGEQQTLMARTVVAKEMTVRETERLVTKALNPAQTAKTQVKDHEVTRLESELVERLGAKVSISHNRKGKGKIVINYQDLAELDGILSKIN